MFFQFHTNETGILQLSLLKSNYTTESVRRIPYSVDRVDLSVVV